jgi:hypothetical protein
MGAAAPWIGLGAGIIGGMARSEGHSAQSGVYRQSAEIERVNANISKRIGFFNRQSILQNARERIADSKRAADVFLSKQEADFAASGIDTGTGTSSDVIEDQIKTFEHSFAKTMQQATAQGIQAEWSAAMDSWNSNNQANKFLAMANMEDYMADTSLLGGVLEGGYTFFDS